ncbi:MAG: DUF917 domain-containing protein [Candidatus Heimdallarchaeota archaeon]|nr:MAG: DUF917 domain-containing protein [Candidatus Heimdallarchaeota archaeon]
MLVRELRLEEAQYLIEGAQILGTGGGGDPVLALKRVKETYSQGKSFQIQEITEFSPTDMICIIGMVGGGVSSQDMKYIENLPTTSDNVMIEAVNLLEDHLETEFTGFVSTEMGPGNIVVPLWVGSLLNRVTVDGDMCGGRSKPMISISTSNVVGISITPLSIASIYGDRIVLKEAISDKRAEDICRMISRLAKGSIGVARCPMSALDCQKGVKGKTISLAIQLGRKISEAANNNVDPLPVIENTLNAQLIFTGGVENFSRNETGGFTWGTIVLKSKAHTLKIWYQNEYLLSWLDEKQYVTCPDSLLVVDRKTGKGLTPWKDDFPKEREVAVFMKSSVPIWKTKKGIEIFGPQVFQSGWIYRSFTFNDE